MIRQRSVVLVVPGFPADESDSTCIPALQSFVRHFGRMVPEVTPVVIAFQYPAPARRYRWHGIEVRAAGGENRRGALRRLTWWRAAAALRSLHRRDEIVAVHSFWLGECTVVAQRLARWLALPHVASIMGQDAMAKGAYLGRIDLDCLTLTCGSHLAARHFAAATGRRVDHVIPFGLDLESFPARAGERDIDVIGVGSLSELKNYALFLHLVSELAAELPALKAVLIGDGPQRRALQQEVERRGLGGCVTLLGELPRAAVIDHLQRSRIFLHPSRYESQGYVFLEALHAGLATVSFDVGYRPASPRVHVCDDARQMGEVLRRLLQEEPANDPVAVDSIDETVAAFRSLYGIQPEADLG